MLVPEVAISCQCVCGWSGRPPSDTSGSEESVPSLRRTCSSSPTSHSHQPPPVTARARFSILGPSTTSQSHLSLATETPSSTSATRCFRRIASRNENMGIIAQFNQHVKRPEKRRCLARIAGYTRRSVAMRPGAEKGSVAKVAEFDPDA